MRKSWCGGGPGSSCIARWRARQSGAVDETELLRIRASLDYLIEGSLRIDPQTELQGVAVGLLFQHPLRAADSLQLAAALAWTEGRPAASEFVCLDLRLRAAAEAVGFSVLPSEVFS
jgi:predicted nucleic acid-binding protein